MTDANADPQEPDDEGYSTLEKYFRPVVDDEGLRPVVIAVVIGISSVIGMGILSAVRDHKPTAIIAMLLLSIMSIEVTVRARRKNGRLGAAGWSVIVVWSSSAIFAIGGHVSGYL